MAGYWDREEPEDVAWQVHLRAAERQRHIGASSLVGLFVPSACSSHKTRVRNEGLDLTSEITKAR